MFSSHQLQPTDVKLRTYTGEALSMYGQFTAPVSYNEQNFPLLVVVAGANGPSLLGRNWLRTLRLNWNSILSLNEDDRLSRLFQYLSILLSSVKS